MMICRGWNAAEAGIRDLRCQGLDRLRDTLFPRRL
jgi:hypothetical protein